MAVIDKSKNFMGLPMNIARGNPMPLDTTEIWYSLAELEAYAKTGATAYVGQIVQLVNETDKTATAYIIANTDGDLVEVGSSTLGDNKTIELTDDGILRIVGAADAKKGAQLVMGDNGIVSWVIPDTTTVEGLSTAVAALDDRVDEVEETLNSHGTRIGDLESTLSGMGGIFNFAGSYTTDQVANLDKAQFQAGDVILVDGVKEYVLVESTDDQGTVTKRWEVLGDPSGVTELQNKVSELETWKTSTSTSLNSLSGKISTAEKNIETINGSISTINTSLNEKASQSDLNLAKADINTNRQNISSINEEITSIKTSLDNKASTAYVDSKEQAIRTDLNKKADQTTVDNIINNYATNSDLQAGLNGKVDKTTYNEKMTALETADSSLDTKISSVKQTADKAALDIVDLTTRVNNMATSSTVEGLVTRVGNVEKVASDNATNITSLQSSVTGLTNNKADKQTVADLSATVAANTKAIEDHEAVYNTLKGRVDGHDTSIQKAQDDATQALANAASAGTAASAAQTKANEAFNKANEVLGTDADDATKNTVYGAKAAAKAADDKAVAAQGEVDALEGVVENLKTSLQTADTQLSNRIAAVEGVINGVQGAMHFVGVSSTDPIEDGVTLASKPDYAPADGDVVIYNDADNNSIEYIYSSGAWVELGDVSAEAKRIQALEGRMDAAEVETAKIAGIQEEITSLKTAKASLEARVKANEDNIASHAGLISGLTTRMDAAEKSITDTAAAIREELRQKAEELSGSITSEATARANADAQLQSQIDTINSHLTWTKLGSV